MFGYAHSSECWDSWWLSAISIRNSILPVLSTFVIRIGSQKKWRLKSNHIAVRTWYIILVVHFLEICASLQKSEKNTPPFNISNSTRSAHDANCALSWTQEIMGKSLTNYVQYLHTNDKQCFLCAWFYFEYWIFFPISISPSFFSPYSWSVYDFKIHNLIMYQLCTAYVHSLQWKPPLAKLFSVHVALWTHHKQSKYAQLWTSFFVVVAAKLCSTMYIWSHDFMQTHILFTWWFHVNT